MGNGLDGGLPSGGTGSGTGSSTGTGSSSGTGSGTGSGMGSGCGSCTGSGADDNANINPGGQFTPPASLNGFAVARSAASTNTIGANGEPIVQPPVYIWKSCIAPWEQVWLRPPNSRNVSSSLTLKDDWCSNGCHPTGVAMVLHWWYVTNQETSGQLTFPYSPPYTLIDSPQVNVPAGEPEGITPLEMCRRLFNSVYPPVRSDGGEFKVDHDALTAVLPQVTSPGSGTPEPLTFVRYATQGAAQADIKSAITYLLLYGPLLIEISQPAHFVLVCGYRNDIMYICDPGDIINNTGNDGKPRWSQSPGMKFNDVNGLGGSQILVTVNCAKSNFTYNSGPQVTWWSNIKAIEGFYFNNATMHTADWCQSPDPVLANPP
jgi:hypothetical protein